MVSNWLVQLFRSSDPVATYGVLTAGIVHTSLTPVFKPNAGEDSLWFAGSGLALCFLGALNIIRRTPANSSLPLQLCRGANIITTVLVALIARKLRAPHVYAVLAFTVLATIHSFIRPNESQLSVEAKRV